MSSAGASPSLADRLVTACWDNDLPSAKAAVADGASVNGKGRTPGFFGLPLTAAVPKQHHDVVVWLLSRDADPNGDGVIFYGTFHSTVAIVQLVIDAGGDVNRKSVGQPPLFTAVVNNSEDKVRMLLAQPSLDLTITYKGKTPEEYGRYNDNPAVADVIAQEVSGKGLPVLLGTNFNLC